MTPNDPQTLRRYLDLIPPLLAHPPALRPAPTRAVYHWLWAYHEQVVAPPDPLRSTPLPAVEPKLVVGDKSFDDAPLAAAAGEAVVLQTWTALYCFLATPRTGSPTATATAASAFDRLIAKQLRSGALLKAAPADSPDLHWYHELILLHALSVFALHARRPDAWRAVERSAEFHLNETQPDHATSEPWGLFAFCCYADTLPLADQLLHAVQTQHGNRPPAVTWMLLSDTLYSVRRHLER